MLMPQSPLKKCRLLAGKTQAEVASAVGVNQSTYQRWEAGKVDVPGSAARKLAKTLGTSVDEIWGRAPAFDYFAADDTVGDNRTYYGEVAAHFNSAGPGLLLPITYAQRDNVYAQIDGGAPFIWIESLDNRLAYLRRDAITDLYFSSEAYDTFGPETYEGTFTIEPDDDFWRIARFIDDTTLIEDDFPQEQIDSVLRAIEDSDRPKELKKLVHDRATLTVWQLSSGQVRDAFIEDDLDLHYVSICFDASLNNDFVFLRATRFHREIFVNLDEVDYMWLPLQRLRDGEYEALEDLID